MSKHKDKKTILILQEQKAARAKRESIRHQTTQRDYSNMRTVKIDERTHVYARMDEDPDEVRERYVQMMKKNSALKPIEKYYKKKEL